ncbi:MAG: hypothetical protein JXQ90_01075 [Cyclobacteriaceae bacterium]
MKRLVIMYVGLIGALNAVGQDFLSWQYTDRYFSVQLGSGQTAYFGELNYPNQIQNGWTHGTLGLEARLLSRIAAKTTIGYYQIKGKDSWAPDSSWQQQRNLSFTSQNWEWTLQGTYYFRKYRGNYHLRWRIDPYVSAGIGATFFNPKTELEGVSYKLRAIQTEGVDYRKVALVFPGAVGVKLRINEFINFNIEGSYRYTSTDYLDDVSNTFPDNYSSELQENLSNRKREIEVMNQGAYDELIEGGRRGNPRVNDQYLFLNFQLEVFIPNGDGPIFKKPSAY